MARGSETQRMHHLLRLPWAKKIYRTRKTEGERPFAEIKQTMRFRWFATRGQANIRGEWDLVCTAANALTLLSTGGIGTGVANDNRFFYICPTGSFAITTRSPRPTTASSTPIDPPGT